MVCVRHVGTVQRRIREGAASSGKERKATPHRNQFQNCPQMTPIGADVEKAIFICVHLRPSAGKCLLFALQRCDHRQREHQNGWRPIRDILPSLAFLCGHQGAFTFIVKVAKPNFNPI